MGRDVRNYHPAVGAALHYDSFTMTTTHLLYLHGFRSSPASNIKLLRAGDHALSDFESHLDDITAFLTLA